LRVLADVLVAQDDLVGARRIYEQAQGLTKEMAIVESSWATDMRLAELLLEEGHAPQSEMAAVKERAELKTAGNDILQSQLDPPLILALLAQGKLDQAERVVVGGRENAR